MKGIIPRAMEQVGHYKTKLEAQGWAYEMEVTFIEIYNEQIRDLLRSMNPDRTASAADKDKKHDIRTDAKKNVYVSDVTTLPVDPNDSSAVRQGR
jgi:kinesin family member C1